MNQKHLWRFLRLSCLLGVAACAFSFFLRSRLPDTFSVSPGQTLELSTMPYLQPMQKTGAQPAQASGSQSVTLGLFGILPVKTVHTQTRQSAVTVCGTPFGIKMFADGAMVVGFSDIYTEAGWRNPGKEAGLRMGDILVRIGSHKATSNEDVAAAVTEAAGGQVELVYSRAGTQHTVQFTPVKEADSGQFKAGIWVRDSSAGIGTLTFVDETNGVYAGLGHPISDSDTGESIALLSGEIVPVTITGVIHGAAGSPGELRGSFSGAAMGDITINGPTGVYGNTSRPFEGASMEVAHIQEVETGPAVILATIEGDTPKEYVVEIERARLSSDEPNRDLLVRITDQQLLEKTGGIVQGMSGSPILQNGKLVGAVTHVLVNDPTRGFGIFAENMLKTAEKATKENQNQAA